MLRYDHTKRINRFQFVDLVAQFVLLSNITRQILLSHHLASRCPLCVLEGIAIRPHAAHTRYVAAHLFGIPSLMWNLWLHVFRWL